MGYGRWTDDSFRKYSKSKGRSVNASGAVVGDYDNQSIFRSTSVDPALNPFKVVRQCCDSEEHPDVVPVILELDITGSMGETAVEVSKKLNVVMTSLYDENDGVKDIQFMVMGVGDMACDRAPAQASQFESDIRIADQMEKIYFEFGGGGNGFESYTLGWYFALNHTDVDAINKRGKKGIIISTGDEPLNPYLPKRGSRASFESIFGDKIEEDIDTKALYEEVSKNWEIFHIHVEHGMSQAYSFERVAPSFTKVMGEDRVICATIDNIADTIINIVKNNANKNIGDNNVSNGRVISW